MLLSKHFVIVLWKNSWGSKFILLYYLFSYDFFMLYIFTSFCLAE